MGTIVKCSHINLDFFSQFETMEIIIITFVRISRTAGTLLCHLLDNQMLTT